MRKTKIIFLFWLGFSPIGFSQILTLNKAIEYAIANSPDLDTAIAQAEIADLQRKIVFTQFLPSLDLTSLHGIQHNYPTLSTTDPWTSGAAVTAKENLYDNGISILQYDQASTNREYAQLNRTRAREQLCLNVAMNYYAYSLAQRVRDITADQLKNMEKQYYSVADMYKQGFKTRADFLRLKTQVQMAKINLLAADNSLATSLVTLKQSMGVTKSDAEAFSFLAIDPDQIPSEIPKTRLEPEGSFEYRLAAIQAKSTSVNIDIARRNFWPQVNVTLGGTFGYQNYVGPADPPYQQYGWNAGLSLNFNLIDWGQRRHQISVTQAQQIVQENQVAQARLAAKAQLDTIMFNLIQLKADYDLAKELLALELENYALIRSNYQEGKAQYLDLISSLNDLFGAKQAFLSAVYGIAQNTSKYRYYEGTLYASTIPH